MSNARNISKLSALGAYVSQLISIATRPATVPAGTVMDFAGATAPSGYLLCYGQAVSRTTYADLFAAIGTAHGAGDGSTTFNLPDCRGRVRAGKDDMGGSAAGRLTTAGSSVDGATLGAAGGVQNVTLTAAQSGVPAHNHTASTGSGGAHSHNVVIGGTSPGSVQGANGFGLRDSSVSVTSDTAAAHTHTVTVNNSTAANASQAHSNTQPTGIFNTIIKT